MVSTNRQVPRATIHKQILDAATEAPDASFEELADEISGASVDLVERVFEEYGDPAEAESEPTVEATVESSQSNAPDMSDPESLATPTDLTEEQRVVLRAIRDKPNATQSELAEHIGVSASTVNRRLHKIDSFEWESRREIVSELLPPTSDGSTVATASDGGADGTNKNAFNPKSNGKDSVTGGTERNHSEEPATSTEIDTSEQRLDHLEQRIGRLESGGGPVKLIDNPELTAKVIRACIHSETVTEEEELRVIKRLLGSQEE